MAIVTTDGEQGVGLGIVAILLLGTLLGLAYNQMGLTGKPRWGLTWIAEDKMAGMATLEGLPETDEAASANGTQFSTSVTDPMAIGAGPSAASRLPEVPELDRPIQIQLDSCKQFFDAGAALFVDAREPEEYEESHIPGAVLMPFDLATSEPERLEALDTGGRPIIVYCGGGTCELSIDLAWELLFAGHSRVLVYMGGFPEWVEAGYAVERGGTSS